MSGDRPDKPVDAEESDASFLARWSRRKQAAEQPAAAEPAPPAPPTADPAESDAEVPLEELPPLDQIDANTDLTPWLKRRLPPTWRRAALRRLWAADPAIRNFRGLAEYDWDYNITGDAPGFGPMRATDDVRLLLARVLGTAPDEKPEAESPPSAPAEEVAATATESTTLALPLRSAGTDEAAAPSRSQIGEAPVNVAVQNDLRLPIRAEDDKENVVKPLQKRRGGRATPQ